MAHNTVPINETETEPEPESEPVTPEAEPLPRLPRLPSPPAGPELRNS